MDAHATLRQIPFPVVAQELGLGEFKTRRNDGQTEWYGKCPIHQAKNNHTAFSFRADGLFKCFSCNAKGRGVIDLVMQVKDIKFSNAVALLEPIAQTKPTTPKAEHPPAVEQSGSVDDTMKPFKGSYEKFKAPCEWLTNRIPCEDTLNRFKVFYYDNPTRTSSYSKKVMLAILGTDGQTYGYLGRSIHGEDIKYQFPAGFPKHRFLWGAYQALQLDPAQRKTVYLVESPFCVMKFALYGLPAVSPFGWSVSDEQVETLAGLCKGVVFLPDSNKLEEARSTTHKVARRLWVRCPALPVEDPESLTYEQVLAL